MKDNELKNLFQDKLGQHQAPVKAELWSSISSQVPSAGAAAAGASISIKAIVIAAAVVVTAVVGLITLVQKSENPAEQVQQDKVEQESPIETADVAIESEEIVQQETIITQEKAELPVQDAGAAEPSSVEDLEENPIPVGESQAQEAKVPDPQHLKAEVSEQETAAVTNSSTPTAEEPEAAEVEEKSPEINVALDPNDPMKIRFGLGGEYSGYIWDFGDGERSEALSGNHRYSEANEYTVRLMKVVGSDQEEVSSTSVVTRSLPKIVLPNIFTPYSSPGSNDIYSLDQIASSEIDRIHIRIYSKEGELVFESDSIDFKWDGKDRFGNELKTGTYIAIAEAWNTYGDRSTEQEGIYLKR